MTTEPQVFGISKEPAVLFALVLSTAVSSLVSPVIIYLGLPNSDASLTSTFAYAVVALLGALLGLLNVVDSVTRRIPNQVLLAFTVVLVPLVLAQTLVSSEWGKLGLAIAVSAGWFVAMLIFTVAKPDSFGGGDLKAIPLVMLPLGLFAYWVPLLWVVLSLVFATFHSTRKRSSTGGKVPFAPSMNIALPITLGIYSLITTMATLPTS
ncbi:MULTISPECIES: prepilin peptidase [Glutamicibacter]|uniref:prepilin peptidase n=1 Tax=Glutamicibacter TaxID=1742989 RepID=UPI003FD472A5